MARIKDIHGFFELLDSRGSGARVLASEVR
jgi:hypothetical protein